MKNLLRNGLLLCILWAVAIAVPSHAQSTEQPELTGQDIARIVSEALATQGYIAAARVADARHFYPCAEPPSVKPLFKSWDTVQIQCNTPRFWKVAIRTNAVASGKTGLSGQKPSPSGDGTMLQVVNLRSSLKRGETITETDVNLLSSNPSMCAGYFTDLNDVIGRRMNVPIGAGTILLARHLGQRWMIEKGDPVSLEMTVGSIRVASPGKAEENGQFGDIIRVRNNSSGRVVRGTVIKSRIIEVHANIN